MVSYQSAQPDLWPLTLTRHFPPRNSCSLDIFSFWDRDLWSLEMVVMMWISQYICSWWNAQTVNHQHQQPCSPLSKSLLSLFVTPLYYLSCCCFMSFSQRLHALRCCRVVVFVCFFFTLDSSRGRKEMHQIIATYIVNIAPSIVRTVTHVRWQPCWRRFTSDGLSDAFTPHW